MNVHINNVHIYLNNSRNAHYYSPVMEGLSRSLDIIIVPLFYDYFLIIFMINIFINGH